MLSPGGLRRPEDQPESDQSGRFGMDEVGSWFDGVWSDWVGFLDWLTGQWWFWVLAILVVLGVLVGLSVFFWGFIIAIGFSSWRRALVSVPILGFLVFLLVQNFSAVLDWVNLYWPLTAVPVLIVLGLPLVLIFSGLGGGSSSSASGAPLCGTCGGADHVARDCFMTS